MDQSRQQKGAPHNAGPAGSRSVERGIISGDNLQFGRVRRRSHLSQSESSGAEEERLGSSVEAGCSYGRSPVLQAMQAESPGQGQLASSGSGPPSFSPRSPNARGPFGVHSRRTNGQKQDEGHTIPTVKASGTPHRHVSGGRHRTSSESDQGGKGSKGPHPKKRGPPEMKNKPRLDKCGTFDLRNGKEMMCV